VEVIKSAEMYMQGASFETIYGIGFSRSYGPAMENPHMYARGPLTLPFSPLQVKNDMSYLHNFDVKKEDDISTLVSKEWQSMKMQAALNKAEAEQQATAVAKDVNEAFMKEVRAMASQFKEGMGMVSQLANMVSQQAHAGTPIVPSALPTNTPRMQNGTIMKPSGNTPTYREYVCFMCHAKDHMMHTCPKFKEFID
jgi:hypothetical protein